MFFYSINYVFLYHLNFQNLYIYYPSIFFLHVFGNKWWWSLNSMLTLYKTTSPFCEIPCSFIYANIFLSEIFIYKAVKTLKKNTASLKKKSASKFFKSSFFGCDWYFYKFKFFHLQYIYFSSHPLITSFSVNIVFLYQQIGFWYY